VTHSHHDTDGYSRAFKIGAALNLGFVLVEVAGGVLSHSLALLADAGHNLTDVFGLLLAWAASRLASRRPTERRTYGLRRSTVLASLANAVVLLVAVGGIVTEAIRRFQEPRGIAGASVIGIALLGVVVNAATALSFRGGRKADLNARAAFLHLAADAAVSLGVVVAGIVILATGWTWIDPAVSVVIALVILAGTWSLLRESLDLALDAVPAGIDPAAVQLYLASLPGVTAVHDLHIWGMSTTHAALTAHLVRPGAEVDDALLSRACRELHDRFGIEHATIQVESGDGAGPCRFESEDVV
jgi:cobalt-zinc-cadmium efflux system protein